MQLKTSTFSRKKVTISAHTNGNIATKMLEKAGSNWGTNVKSSDADGAGQVKAEIIYIQDFKEMHAIPFVIRDGAGVKFVVGPDIELSSQNDAEFFLKSKHMNDRKKIDSFNKDNVYKILHREESKDKPYIDFDAEYKKLYAQSKAWATANKGITIIFEPYEWGKNAGKIIKDGVETKFDVSKIDQNEWNNNKTDNAKLAKIAGISDEDYKKATIVNLIDQNNRTINVTNAEAFDGYVYLNLPASIVTASTPLYLQGMEKTPYKKDIIINIDTKGEQTTVASQIQFKYKDGSTRTPHETELFNDSTVVWNFVDSTKPDYLFTGNVHLQNTVQGSILAPKGDFTGGQNIDGSVIVKTFSGSTGETHRWDFQGNKEVYLEPKSCGNIEVTVSNVANGTKVTVDGKEYTVTNGKITVPSTLAGDLYEIKIGNEKAGEVIIKGDCTPDYQVNPDFQTPALACGKQYVTVEGVPSGSFVVNNGQNVSVNEIPMGTEPGTYPVVKDGKEVGTITIVAGNDQGPCKTGAYTEKPGDLEVKVEFIKGVGCDKATLTLTTADDKVVGKIEVGDKVYGVTNGKVIVDGKVYEAKDGKVTIGEQSYDVTDYVLPVNEDSSTATFTNLVPGEYKVVPDKDTCIELENPDQPTAQVPAGGKGEVVFKEEAPKPGDVKGKVTFVEGVGCDQANLKVITANGDEVGKIEVGDKVYGVTNGKVIVDGKVYTAERKGDKTIVTIKGEEKEVTPYVIEVTESNPEAIFTNLMPGDYKVVEDSDCIQPTDEKNPPVTVTPNETPEVPFEEIPPAPGELEAKVEFIKGLGCDEATLMLETAEGDKVGKIEVDGKVYGVTNGKVIVDGKVYEAKEGKVTIGEQSYEVTNYALTVNEKDAANTTFTNLVPGEYKVVPDTDTCIELENPENPTVVVPEDGKGEVTFKEQVPPPGHIEVPVQFVKGAGCDKATFSLEDAKGNAVQKIAVDGKDYGVTDGKVIVDGKVYQADGDGNITIGEETFTKDDQKPYTITVEGNDDKTNPGKFENLVPGSYKVVLDDKAKDCVKVSDKDTTTVVEDETSKVPFEEVAKPGHIEVPVEFIQGAGCTEATFTLQSVNGDKVQEVKQITIDETTYGVTNGQVIVDGKLYKADENGVITIDEVEYKLDELEAYTITVNETDDKTTGKFTNLVPGEYKVESNNTTCVTVDNSNQPVTVNPGEATEVPAKEKAPSCGEEYVKVTGDIPEGSVVAINGEEVPVDRIPMGTAPGEYTVYESGKEIGTLEVNAGTKENPCKSATFTATPDVPKAPSCDKEFADVLNTVPSNGLVVIDQNTKVSVNEISLDTKPGTYKVVDSANKELGTITVVAGNDEVPCTTATYKQTETKEPPTCSNEYVGVPSDIPAGSYVVIGGKQTPVDNIPMGTNAGTYKVYDKADNEIGTLKVVAGTDSNPCATATYTKAPEKPSCSNDYVGVPTNIPAGSYVVINGKQVPVNKIPMGTNAGSYKVYDKSDNEIGTLTVKAGTATNPCKSATYKQAEQSKPVTPTTPTKPTAPSCGKTSVDVPSNIPSSSYVVINGEKVPVAKVPMGTTPGDYYVMDTTGNILGTITIVKGTDSNPCTTATYEPVKSNGSVSTSDQSVTIPDVPDNSFIIIDGEEYPVTQVPLFALKPGAFDHIPVDSTIIIDGNEYPVTQVPLFALKRGAYPVVDKAGNVIDVIEITPDIIETLSNAEIVLDDEHASDDSKSRLFAQSADNSEKQQKLPQTNGETNYIVVLIGLLLVAASSTLLARRRREQ